MSNEGLSTKRATIPIHLLLGPASHAPCQCACSAKGLRYSRPLKAHFLQELLPTVFEVSNDYELQRSSSQAYRATVKTSEKLRLVLICLSQLLPPKFRDYSITLQRRKVEPGSTTSSRPISLSEPKVQFSLQVLLPQLPHRVFIKPLPGLSARTTQEDGRKP